MSIDTVVAMIKTGTKLTLANFDGISGDDLLRVHECANNKTLLEFAIFRLSLTNTKAVVEAIKTIHAPSLFVPPDDFKASVREYVKRAYHKHVHGLSGEADMPTRRILRNIKDYLKESGILTDHERRESFTFRPRGGITVATPTVTR